MVKPGIFRVVALVGALSATSDLCAQPRAARPGQPEGPVIAELHIAVQDLNTREQRGHVLPGQRLTLRQGDRVRLRMVGIPAQSRRAPRYPSARFDLVGRGSGAVGLERVNAEQGSVILNTRPTRRGGGEPAVIRYELLEDLNVSPGLRQGTITVDVVEPRPEPRPRLGVTLYEHQDFRGRSETFYGDDDRLNDNLIRHDTASSARVDPGCEIVLYEHPYYEGRATVLTGHTSDLNGSRVGNDSVSSLQVRCGEEATRTGSDPGPRRRGVTLYEHQDFQGRSETFYEDDSYLNDNHIRHDSASSVRVDFGCRVILFEHPSFEGRSTALSEDLEDLNGSRVGNDSVSSLEVRCERR